ncbi:VOC family protein [Zavarzinia sp. CC-PAN008]|uniref:VOC family protein n=1 Tax=Zavarzinia sp. CC-PAN008 TaxID=3243332 RepID=UPI003F746C83
MPAPHGAFVWYELVTPDTAAAAAFYGNVIGWGTQDGGSPDMDYTLFTMGSDLAAGLMAPPPGMDMGPVWIGYVAVDDVDATAAKATALGGTVHQPPHDIPGVGRFAIIGDPQGAVLAIFRGGPDWTTEPAQMGQDGRGGWHELYAADHATILDFYVQLFGWRKDQTLEMDGITYQLFMPQTDAAIGGGIMTKPAEMPMPSWQYYFQVPGIDTALDQVKGNGGQVLNGPMEVPGGAWIVNAIDPQGAMFSLVGQRG